MAKVFIEETTLTNIGNAIRDKEGSSELIPVTDMATRIAAIESGGGAEITELSITTNGTYTAPNGAGYSPVIVNVPQDNNPSTETLTVTGNCQYRFSNNGWNGFLKQYGNQVITKDIWMAPSMFVGSDQLKSIPFQINVNNITGMNEMFSGCSNLTICPKIRGNITISTNLNLSSIFYATRISDAEDLFEPTAFDAMASLKVTSAYSSPKFQTMFGYCWDLRQLPSWFYKLRFSEESTAYPSQSYTLYRHTCRECWSLNEVTNFPVLRCAGAQNNNMFDYTFDNCYRLKNFTFETDNGTPYVVKWKSQVLDLSKNVGSGNSSYSIPTESNGITADKQVTDDASYQALKDDPDWFTYNIQYTRYDHDSAVRTINSLPDTSAYLAEAGGTNTIKFQAEVGLKTDGGLISSLTEEEIAVAAAKGWTVTLV